MLLNSVIGNYITIVSSIDDSLEDLEEELLTISEGKDIGIQIQSLRRQYMTMKKSVRTPQRTVRKTAPCRKSIDS